MIQGKITSPSVGEGGENFFLGGGRAFESTLHQSLASKTPFPSPHQIRPQVYPPEYNDIFP